jgi:ERCC4-type nuclease
MEIERIIIIIITDSREQTPLDFPYEFVSEIKVEKLPVGDYGCEFVNGYRPPVSFERKSKGDLFNTMGRGYARFKREIELAKELNIRLIIIIEATMTSVLKGFEKSDLSGISIIRKLMTLLIKYNVYPVFCKDRDEMGLYIYEFFSSIGRLTMKGKSNYADLPTLSGKRDIPVIRT